VWKCIRRGWEGFSKYVKYKVGMDLRCGFGIMFGVVSNL
jgi:hypothetical protein